MDALKVMDEAVLVEAVNTDLAQNEKTLNEVESGKIDPAAVVTEDTTTVAASKQQLKHDLEIDGMLWCTNRNTFL